jgi:hypothetical protein
MALNAHHLVEFYNWCSIIGYSKTKLRKKSNRKKKKKEQTDLFFKISYDCIFTETWQLYICDYQEHQHIYFINLHFNRTTLLVYSGLMCSM